MSQEETFTSEQFSAEANRHGGLVADMLNYAATIRQQAAQPDDSRCPPTCRREEAVKVLIGMGWSWDGKQWNAPVQQAARVDEDAVRGLFRLWRQIERSDEPQSEFDKGYEQASQECAAAPSAPQDAQKERK